MDGQAKAAQHELRDSLGIIVSAVGAVVLLFVLWQIATSGGGADERSRLIDRGASDDRAHEREFAAMGLYREETALLRGLQDYRDAQVGYAQPQRAGQLRAVVDADMRSLLNAVDRVQSKGIDLRAQMGAVSTAWKAARLAPAIDGLGETTASLTALFDATADTSGFEYDQSVVLQNLADFLFSGLPRASESAAVGHAIAYSAVTGHTMTLARRLMLASDLTSMRTNFEPDVTDNIGDVLAVLETRDPNFAPAYRRAAAIAAAMPQAGSNLRRLLSTRVLIPARPSVSLAALDTPALRARRTADAAISIFQTILQRGLEQRAAADALKARELYIAALAAAVVLVGLMLMAGQIVARRDRRVLAAAQRESETLAAELARERAERALRLSEAQFRAVFDAAAMGIAILRPNGDLVDANAVFRDVYGSDARALIAGRADAFADLIAGERDVLHFEHQAFGVDGKETWTDVSLSKVADERGAPMFVICMFRDMTALRQSQRRIEHSQTHDELTGLANRAAFEERVHGRFLESAASVDAVFAVLFLDLDNFKEINESLGHNAGDYVLGQVAHRLRMAVDADDVVARWGSDEFAVFVGSLGDIFQLESVARRILNALTKPISLGGRSVFVTASIGIAVASRTNPRTDDVVRDATVAMEFAKSSGGGRYAIFDSHMAARAQRRLQLATDLRLALTRGELHLVYQPIVTIGDGVPVGCEALLRWNHPVEGLMTPDEFIGIVEQIGMATPVGRFVIESACSQYAYWMQRRGSSDPFVLHVNVSPSQLLDPDFEAHLVTQVHKHAIPPEVITLEITENVVIEASSRVTALIESLRQRGFKICIDDFGTGYSSLRYLQQFKLDAIKIDRTFVCGLDGELASEPIVRTLMTLAEAFGVHVVAEGLETTRQREELRAIGCRLAQGYFFSRPLGAQEMVASYPAILGRAPRPATL